IAVSTEMPRDRFVEGGVARVHESIEIAASSPCLQREVDLERDADATSHRERERGRLTAFDPADGPARHAGSIREVPLPPASPDPRHPHCRPESHVVHARQHVGRTLPRGYFPAPSPFLDRRTPPAPWADSPARISLPAAPTSP